MALTVGFILLTHDHPTQIQRLIDRLNRMFNYPPIVCHHDFSKCPFAIEQFSRNVLFVQPSIQTGWGQYSLIEAAIQSIKRLHRRLPDWTIFLSGSDYPIKSATQIISDLASSQADLHMIAEWIDPAMLQSDWHHEMYARYYTKWLPMPAWIATPLKLNWQRLRIKPMALVKPFVPYSPELQCYAGGQWFCGNARSLNYILNYHYTQPKLSLHLKDVMFPEETYFQTIVANAANLTIDSNDWRYIDWSEGGSHPKILTLADLPKILESSAHFARKFEPDSPALDELDRYLNLN
ncbi:MAG: beta-1,6-N-acetylglucosaminyltransferase [Leptolyngbya sp. Prado105]|jgi:hypothetical protein|nr:beta-1,6-N-acetylglucosaminyltransferase [Leptolyngbya sp. Prado105]